ncbi:MAG: sigma-70 family RNA polymerase sigma factor [Acidobacteria bacterium]|nr:sigma-70 family RNA polymerase sigma factor [Acidobacteriota bacterium]
MADDLGDWSRRYLLDLATLLERCRQGDDLAWETFVRRYQGRIFAVAFHYMRDREEARDTAQDIFVKLYQRLDSLREGDAFLPWLLRLARNSCIDRLRRLKVRTPPVAVPVEEAPQLPAAGPSPEQASLAGARVGLLYRALDQLSERNREMILLKDIQELKLNEISDLLALPLGTVKSRSSRARVELAKAVRALDPSYGT